MGLGQVTHRHAPKEMNLGRKYVVDERQAIGSGLARACACTCQHIFAREHLGDGAALSVQ